MVVPGNWLDAKVFFKANFAKWEVDTVILNGKREVVNFNEEDIEDIHVFMNNMPLKKIQSKREGIIFHLNGTETQYIVVAEEFFLPELKDSNCIRDIF